MQYLLLIYGGRDDNAPAADETAIKEMMREYDAFTAMISESGEMQGGNALQDTDTATTVRVRGDETLVTDGPFAETKEVLGGYYLVDCKDLDRAIEVASRIPDVRNGSIEIRPILDLSDRR